MTFWSAPKMEHSHTLSSPLVFYCREETRGPKQLARWKSVLDLQVEAHHQGKARQELEECCLLIAPPGLLSLLSYAPQDHLPRDGTNQSRLDPWHQLTIKKMPQRLANGSILSVVIPSSQITLEMCQVDKETHQHTNTPPNESKSGRTCQSLARTPPPPPHPSKADSPEDY